MKMMLLAVAAALSLGSASAVAAGGEAPGATQASRDQQQGQASQARQQRGPVERRRVVGSTWIYATQAQGADVSAVPADLGSAD